MTSRGILNELQFGFRKNHSTSHAINYSTDLIKDANVNQKHAIGIFIDLSKAFDTIDHSTLLKKLETYEIRGNCNKLLKCCLEDRFQYTKFGEESSNKLKVKFGVPQGSILGPLLFLLYINDLQNSFSDPDCKFVLYADDSNIFVIANTKTEAIIKANKILSCIRNYMLSNLLHINFDKCCYIHFHCKKSKGDAVNKPIYIGSHKIKEVESAKFLGVYLDNKLNWKAHIDFLISKLKTTIAVIRRIKNYLPSEIYPSIYHSLFESHVNYCISAWGNAAKKLTQKIFRMQKKCTRILFGDEKAYFLKFFTCARTRPIENQRLGASFYKRESTKPLFNNYKFLAFQNLFHYMSSMEIFKIILKSKPDGLNNQITMSTRNNLIILPKTKKSNTFLVSASKIWNTIIPQIGLKNVHINSITPISFKKKLKKKLLEIQNLNDPLDWDNQNFDLKKYNS